MAPTQCLPPRVALDFLQFLAKAEGVAKGKGSFWDVEDEEGGELDEDIFRAKVHAYDAALRSQLSCWKDLPEAASERYRSRIEDLTPALEQTLERRRQAAAAPARTEAAAQEVSAEDAAQVTAVAAVVAASVEDVAPLAGGGASGLAQLEALSTEVEAQASADHRRQDPRGSSGSKPGESPWQRRRPKAGPDAAISGQLGKLEEEMANMSEDMKGAVQGYLVNLKKDGERLTAISDSQDKSIDAVRAQTEIGKKLLWSSQLSFFCTMIMVIISIAVFCMMIPFIIFT